MAHIEVDSENEVEMVLAQRAYDAAIENVTWYVENLVGRMGLRDWRSWVPRLIDSLDDQEKETVARFDQQLSSASALMGTTSLARLKVNETEKRKKYGLVKFLGLERILWATHLPKQGGWFLGCKLVGRHGLCQATSMVSNKRDQVDRKGFVEWGVIIPLADVLREKLGSSALEDFLRTFVSLSEFVEVKFGGALVNKWKKPGNEESKFIEAAFAIRLLNGQYGEQDDGLSLNKDRRQGPESQRQAPVPGKNKSDRSTSDRSASEKSEEEDDDFFEDEPKISGKRLKSGALPLSVRRESGKRASDGDTDDDGRADTPKRQRVQSVPTPSPSVPTTSVSIMDQLLARLGAAEARAAAAEARITSLEQEKSIANDNLKGLVAHLSAIMGNDFQFRIMDQQMLDELENATQFDFDFE